MPESPTESAPGAWSVPECPFTIAYVPEVMDDIRLAVVDAFFSLPRGGAEIGGILLGWHTQKRVTVAEYVALDCEHATGPSFVLSAADETRLRTLLDESGSNPAGLQPVGWYHSHTRSEIFLSDADQEIHRRFFPEPWQIALVLKPHTFQPMRCGFFFREADDSMHATASYQEFVLEAMPLRTVPTGEVPKMAADTPAMPPREPESARPVISVSAVEPARQREAAPAAAAAVAPAPAPAVVAVPMEAPRFATVVPEARSWLWLKVIVALSIGLGAGAIGFETRQSWLPKLTGTAAPAVSAAESLGLSTFDTDGQLQIRWDRSSPVVQQAASAVLTITDGELTDKVIPLDSEHLKSGAFTYGRDSGQVDVTLAVKEPGGQTIRSVAAFVGRAPAKTAAQAAPAEVSPPSPSPDAQISKLKRDLAAQQERAVADQNQLAASVAKAKKDLALEVERNRKLEKSLGEAQAQTGEAAKLRKDLAAANDHIKKLTKSLADSEGELRQQQRKRMGAQDPGVAK